MAEFRDSLDDLLDPFWRSTTMYRESVMFIGRADGSLDDTLLFRPDEILSVTNSAADIAFTEGLDYTIDRHAGRITRTASSRMPWVPSDRVAAADGELTHSRTVIVSYTHQGDRWRGFVPASARALLPRVTRRLEAREPLTICLTGDSISEGYDASGFHRLPPYQPPYGTLVASGLERAVGSRIQFHNFGTAGWTSADALWDTERITAVKPDLVIVAFGMNDATYADADEYIANISSILSRVRAEVAPAEIILVSPMLPTPECAWIVHSRFAEYRDALATLTGEGVALADMTTVWSALVARKNPRDLSGNGWNHPNDFGHRIYAQTILATMGCLTERK
jgi:acyl-CoA thioesterase I